MPPKGSGTRGRPAGSTNSVPASKASATASKAKRATGTSSTATTKFKPAKDAATISLDSDDDNQPRRGSSRMDLADDDEAQEQEAEDDEDEEDERVKIPPELITRILHEFFEQDGTRITKDANSAVASYVDIFVREAIARAASERRSGFLEVDDLEKIAPQLLMDL